MVAEFLRQSIAPLQEHSRPMWMLAHSADDIRLSSSKLSAAAVDTATHALFGAGGIGKPTGEIRPLHKRKQSLQDQIRQEMPVFNERGLVGAELPQEEEAEADSTAGDVGAEEETSQVSAAREVVVLDGDDEGRAPSPELLVAYGPLDGSDAEGRWCL